MGRNFANKLWNAARFLLLNLEGYTPGEVSLAEAPLEDRWILSRLATTAAAVTEQLEGYHFSEAVRSIYDFTWSEFCDWYVEMSKGRLRDEGTRPLAQRVLAGVLDGILRLVHPFMPFVAESIWQALGEAAGKRGLPDPAAVRRERVHRGLAGLSRGVARPGDGDAHCGGCRTWCACVREVRNRYMVDARTPLDVTVRCCRGRGRRLPAAVAVHRAAGRRGQAGVRPGRDKAAAGGHAGACGLRAVRVAAGLIDAAAETARLEKQQGRESCGHLQAARGKLQNSGFMDRAPAEVVQQVKDQVADLEAQLR